jgi:Zn-dependent protease
VGFDLNALLQRAALFLPPLILSLTFHECAHAWSARKLGDDTAEQAGRLTLNPLPHIDLLGTILLPLVGAPFGWAKPVPVDPSRFRRDIRMATGVMLTSAAGPLSNLLLATLCAIAYGLLGRFQPEWLSPGQGIQPFIVTMIRLNVALMVFNLLPIPPLDGGGVVQALVPRRFQGAWESFARVAPLVLLALVILPSSPIGWIVSGPMALVLDGLSRIVVAIATP